MTESMDFNEMNKKVVAEFRDNAQSWRDVRGHAAGPGAPRRRQVRCRADHAAGLLRRGGRIFGSAVRAGDDNPACTTTFSPTREPRLSLAPRRSRVALPLSGAERDEYSLSRSPWRRIC